MVSRKGIIGLRSSGGSLCRGKIYIDIRRVRAHKVRLHINVENLLSSRLRLYVHIVSPIA